MKDCQCKADATIGTTLTINLRELVVKSLEHALDAAIIRVHTPRIPLTERKLSLHHNMHKQIHTHAHIQTHQHASKYTRENHLMVNINYQSR